MSAIRAFINHPAGAQAPLATIPGLPASHGASIATERRSRRVTTRIVPRTTPYQCPRIPRARRPADDSLLGADVQVGHHVGKYQRLPATHRADFPAPTAGGGGHRHDLVRHAVDNRVATCSDIFTATMCHWQDRQHARPLAVPQGALLHPDHARQLQPDDGDRIHGSNGAVSDLPCRHGLRWGEVAAQHMRETLFDPRGGQPRR